MSGWSDRDELYIRAGSIALLENIDHRGIHILPKSKDNANNVICK